MANENCIAVGGPADGQEFVFPDSLYQWEHHVYPPSIFDTLQGEIVAPVKFAVYRRDPDNPSRDDQGRIRYDYKGIQERR